MHDKIRRYNVDLAIIGAGLAGTSAAVYALNRRISCAIAGDTGALAYTTGYFDLLGFLAARPVDNPWESLTKLQAFDKKHPLGALKPQSIRRAFTDYIAYLQRFGISYTGPVEENLTAITPAGTLKPTLCIPKTMANGVEAFRKKTDCTIFGLRGLRGFSSQQICANLQGSWPTLRPRLISFPGHQGGELYPEAAARGLEVEAKRKLLAEIINCEAGKSPSIGLPAILGIHNPDTILEDLQQRTGRTIFEIPTMPPAVPGIRLREMFARSLPEGGVTMVPQQKVHSIDFPGNHVLLQLTDNCGAIEIKAQTALLATGRFLSGGLQADFAHISEPLAGLWVHQPATREDWYRQEYFDGSGHQIHLAGIETDSSMRPLNRHGKIHHERLFAAGTVLAHQDWIRQRCGSGVALGTAYQAVEAISRFLGK